MKVCAKIATRGQGVLLVTTLGALSARKAGI